MHSIENTVEKPKQVRKKITIFRPPRVANLNLCYKYRSKIDDQKTACNPFNVS